MVIKRKVKGSKKRKNGVSVDFTGVETGGRPCPDGSFRAEITAFEQEESSTGNPMIVAKYKILQGKGKGAIIFDNLSLQPQALFRLKSLCEALGIESDGATDLDFDDFVGQEVLVDVENETFEGKRRARAAGYAAVDSEGAEEESEEEDEDEPEEDAEDEDEDEDEEEEKPKKSSKAAVKKKGKAKPKDEDEDEDEEEEEEESEDEDEDEDEDDDSEEEDRPTKKVGRVKGKTNTGLVKGAKVSFKDGKKTIRGTVVSIKNKTARIEDKNGDEFDVPSEQVELL